MTELGGSPGLVLIGGDSRSEGSGFESQCRIWDGYFFSLIFCKIVLIESFPCNSIEALEKRTKEIIRQL